MTPMGHFSIRIHTEIAETAAECVSNDAGSAHRGRTNAWANSTSRAAMP